MERKIKKPNEETKEKYKKCLKKMSTHKQMLFMTGRGRM